MAILADQDNNKKKGSAPETAAKGTSKGEVAKGKMIASKATPPPEK
jgi:hypothetical protein